MTHLMLFLLRGCFTQVEKQVAFLKHQFCRAKKLVLPTALSFPEVIPLFSRWRSKVFANGCCHVSLN